MQEFTSKRAASFNAQSWLQGWSQPHLVVGEARPQHGEGAHALGQPLGRVWLGLGLGLGLGLAHPNPNPNPLHTLVGHLPAASIAHWASHQKSITLGDMLSEARLTGE